MKLSKVLFLGAALAIIPGLLVRPASAVTVTFASYQYSSGSFDYFADGSFTATIIGSFSYANIAGLPVGLRPPPTDPSYTAVIQIDGIRAGDAIDLGGGFVSQAVKMTTFSITKVGAPFAGVNLLSGDLTGTLLGNGTSGSIFGSLMAGNSITYFADLLDFSTSIDRDFSFTLNSVTPGFFIVPGPPGSQNLAPFFATNTGIFGSTPTPSVVPEPGLIAVLCGFGVSGSVFILGLRRRKA